MTRFETYCRRKEELALHAVIPGFATVTASPGGQVPIGNEWTRARFDGPFYRSPVPDGDLPLISLAFVQSRDGNTVADNPSTLGGGETDKHLIYEGLSRVDADAVMAGAGTARGERIVFSVWHPELVALRRDLGRPRHPAQVVITNAGDLPVEGGLMFEEPGVRVFLVTRSAAAPALRQRIAGRPWIEVVDAGEPLSMTVALRHLRRCGIGIVSAVGGRRTAAALFDARLVRDLYLTTSPIDAGEPDTPLYEGPPLPLTRVVEKAGQGPETGVRFEHFVVGIGDQGSGIRDAETALPGPLIP